MAFDTPAPAAAPHIPGDGIDLRARPLVRVGRASDNDLVLDDLRASRHHAEIRAAGDAAEVRDLGSSNGTFVNGRRVTTAPLADGDLVGLGAETVQYAAGRVRLVGDRHSAWFGAVDLVVNVGQRRILDEVGFALEPSSVLAVVGPSGSGKTTMLNALTGFRPADSGNVVFGGRDLYDNYDHMRLRMGLVPQADILHTQLTVRQALEYSAELRFPRDVAAAARSERVREVMAELNLDNRADVRIDRLSGGQRKRVSVGCELLTQPALLFLDEPTSGLDPGNEVAMMTSLRELARAGRTVVVVTHSVQSLDLCDRLLVLAPGGKLAYFGPPDDALRYFAGFGAGASYAGMFRALEEEKDADWKARFRADARFEGSVREPLASADLVAIPRRPNIDPPPPPTPAAHQVAVLIRRYLQVLRADRGFLITLALQGPIFGLLFSLMFKSNKMTLGEAFSGSILIWLIVVGATWLGTSNAIREIVKELPIYRRERAIGLSAGAYLLSKVLVLTAITVAQVAVMVPIALRTQTLPVRADDPDAVAFRTQFEAITGQVAPAVQTHGVVFPNQVLELIFVAMVIGVAGMALGLLISAVAGGTDRAASLLPIVLVAQVIVSSPLPKPPEVELRLAGYAFSAQWGMAAAASTLDLHTLREPYVYFTAFAARPDPDHPPDMKTLDWPSWHHTVAAWALDMGLLAALTVVCLGGSWYALRALDSAMMEGRHQRRRAVPMNAKKSGATA